MADIDSQPKAGIPLKSVVHLALWAGAFGLFAGAYLSFAYLGVV